MTGNAYRLQYFIDIVGKQSLEELEERFPEPFLVVLCGGLDANDEFSTRIDGRGDFLEAVETGQALDPNAITYHLVKREGANHFSRMIMIGRASNCDIIIQSAEISKLHAYISQKRTLTGRAYTLADGPSRNGTALNDKRILPGKTRPLQNGDQIALGPKLLMQFFTPKGLYERLLEQAGSGSSETESKRTTH